MSNERLEQIFADHKIMRNMNLCLYSVLGCTFPIEKYEVRSASDIFIFMQALHRRQLHGPESVSVQRSGAGTAFKMTLIQLKESNAVSYMF